MIQLNVYPLDWLVDEKISLLQRVAAAKVPVLYPPPGYRFDYAKLKHLEDRLVEVNRELDLRRQVQEVQLDVNSWQERRDANLRGMQQLLEQGRKLA